MFKSKEKPGLIIVGVFLVIMLVTTASCARNQTDAVTAIPQTPVDVPAPAPTVESATEAAVPSEAPELANSWPDATYDTIPQDPVTTSGDIPSGNASNNTGFDYSGDIPDFSVFDDATLIRYAANSDGAYSEGAFSALAKRFDDHPLELLTAIAYPDEYVDRMNICRGLAGEYIIEGRTDDLKRILDKLFAEQPQGVEYDSAPYGIAHGVSSQLSILGLYEYLDGATKACVTSSGLAYKVTNVESYRVDAMFDDGYTVVEYSIFTLGPGARLIIDKPCAEDSLPPVYCLNYGYELGNPGNTRIDQPMTVSITGDLLGIISIEGGLPVAMFSEN